MKKLVDQVGVEGGIQAGNYTREQMEAHNEKILGKTEETEETEEAPKNYNPKGYLFGTREGRRAKRQDRRLRKAGGMKDVPAGGKGKGLSKLPTSVRNKMGFKKHGGKAKKMYGGIKDRRK